MARDYKAEYAARNARSRAKYGVSYGKQRAAIEQGKKLGAKPNQIREFLKAMKGGRTDPTKALRAGRKQGIDWQQMGRGDDPVVAYFRQYKLLKGKGWR